MSEYYSTAASIWNRAREKNFTFQEHRPNSYFIDHRGEYTLRRSYTLSEMATARYWWTQSQELETSTTGFRSEVNLRSSPLFLIGFFAVLAAGAFAQVRDVPRPILVDVIGPNGQSSMNRVRAVSTGVPSTNNRDVFTEYDVEKTTFQLMNSERAANGLAPLRWNDTLAEVARAHSSSMAANSYFSHRGIDGSMVDDRAAEFGVTNWLAIGENIAYLRGYDDPEAMAIEKWLNSPSHRRNLLSQQWKESAIGVSRKADGTYYFTQVFVLNR